MSDYECLIRLRYYSHYSVNESRIFTQEMKESVVDFQQKSQLDADGIVGYRTWESLFFTGRPTTERLTEEDFVLVARLFDVEVAALKAVQQVETGGKRRILFFR